MTEPARTTRLACESANPCSTSQPSGNSASGVGHRVQADEVVVRDRQRQADGEQRRDRRRRLRSRQAALDPHEQRDQEQRSDVERVPLGDAERLLRSEHGHHEHEPEGQAERGCDEDAVSLRQPPRHQRQEDQRRERDHAEREAELSDVVREPLRHLPHRVVGAAGHLVGAEDPERRAAPGQLEDENPEQSLRQPVRREAHSGGRRPARPRAAAPSAAPVAARPPAGG